MNDEFLYAARREPSPEFANRLRRKLRQQEAQRSARSSVVRTLLAIFLVGSSAVAATLWIVGKRPERNAPAPIQAQQVEPPRPVSDQLSPYSLPSVAGGGAEVDVARENGASQSTPVARNAIGSQSASDTAAHPIESTTRGPAANISGGVTAPAVLRMSVVASPLSYPLTKIVADTLGRSGSVPTPQVIIREPATAFRNLCQTSASQQPDFVVASRRIAAAEFETCRRNGVTDLLESKIGYQAVVIAGAPTSTPLQLSVRDVYLALAKRVPDPAEPTSLVGNPFITWDQINPRLDFRTIEVLGPRPDAVLRHVFEQLVLEPGCEGYPWIKSLRDTDRQRYTEICHSLRSDRLYHEVEQTNTLIQQNLWADPNALVILDYNFYQARRTELAGTVLDGVEPTSSTLAAGTYPFARPVYVYARKLRIERNPGALFWFELNYRANAPSGYLARDGFVALDEQERRTQNERRSTPLLAAPNDTNP